MQAALLRGIHAYPDINNIEVCFVVTEATPSQVSDDTEIMAIGSQATHAQPRKVKRR